MSKIVSLKKYKDKKTCESLKVMADYFRQPLDERKGLENYLRIHDKHYKQLKKDEDK